MSGAYKTKISIDVMGGDHAPEAIIDGINIAAKRHDDIFFILYGNVEVVLPLLEKSPLPADRYALHHCDEVITADMKPSAALRRSKNSSMRLAIEAVLNGQADGVVSAGNTGAYMALAKLILKTLDGIDRPAIAGAMPTTRGASIMLDMGANVECSPENLVQFAMMGEVYAKSYLHIKKPSVGLLNIGSEILKGNDSVKEAHSLLTEGDFVANFQGFVEGDSMLEGKTDVVVTDGFSGNIALKTVEGAAKLITSFFKTELKKSFFARIGVLLAMGVLKKLRKKIDPRMYNGAILLGLNGVVVKSHGGTDAVGFASAIYAAHELIANKAVTQIQNGLKKRIDKISK